MTSMLVGIKHISVESREVNVWSVLKVIDLRESGRRMEEQLDEAEQQAEVQAWKVQELNHALQAERLEGERRLVAMQRDHQEKVDHGVLELHSATIKNKCERYWLSKQG